MLIVANKLDKLKKSEIEPNLERIRQTLCPGGEAEVVPFSAETGVGKDALIQKIGGILHL